MLINNYAEQMKNSKKYKLDIINIYSNTAVRCDNITYDELNMIMCYIINNLNNDIFEFKLDDNIYYYYDMYMCYNDKYYNDNDMYMCYNDNIDLVIMINYLFHYKIQQSEKIIKNKNNEIKELKKPWYKKRN